MRLYAMSSVHRIASHRRTIEWSHSI
jgi:hypothetical protein